MSNYQVEVNRVTHILSSGCQCAEPQDSHRRRPRFLLLFLFRPLQILRLKYGLVAPMKGVAVNEPRLLVLEWEGDRLAVPVFQQEKYEVKAAATLEEETPGKRMENISTAVPCNGMHGITCLFHDENWAFGFDNLTGRYFAYIFMFNLEVHLYCTVRKRNSDSYGDAGGVRVM